MNGGGFHALGNLWLLGLAVPLVVFYFLKLRRPRQEIPSLALWRQVLQDHRVNSPFQRFKRNLLLLLQLLLLLGLVLAASQPFWRRQAEHAQRLPILIDNSASMGAQDRPGGATRLAAAQQRVAKIIDELLPGQELCLISFSRTARKRTGFTNNKRILREALQQIEVEPVASELEEALRLAQALARSEPFDEVLLISDGNLPARAAFDLSFRLNYQRLPPAAANLGLTTLHARRAIDGGWDVLVQVEAGAGADGAASVVFTEDGQEIARERVTFVGTTHQRLGWHRPAGAATVLGVSLQPDQFDSLAADNTGQIVLPAARPLRVWVPEAMIGYRHALQGMPGLELLAAGTDPCDLLITDRSADLARPAATRLLVGLVPPGLETVLQLSTNHTVVVDWQREAALLQHVELGDLVILDNPQLRPGAGEADIENAGYEILTHGRQGPLIVHQQADGVLTLALLFHTDRSTLPYRVGFPILVANVVQAAWQQAGLAEAAGSNGVFAAGETTLAGVERIEFNERLSVAAAVGTLPTDRPLWRTAVWLALAVLLAEWWYFQRRPGGWR